jgi:Uma2 family endonuclease
VAHIPQTSPDERFVLWNVDWKTYENLLDNLGDRHIRLTYDGENLELMSPSRWHEIVSTLLGHLVRRMAEELEIPISSGGAMTFRRKDLLRGLEPDQCFWVANEPRVRGTRELDLRKDPPPDLALEVDITHCSLDRQGIYAKLRVPEIWRFDGTSLHILVLQSKGKYAESKTSLAFPFLPVHELLRFLPGEGEDETSSIRRFVKWLRKQHFRPRAE